MLSLQVSFGHCLLIQEVDIHLTDRRTLGQLT